MTHTILIDLCKILTLTQICVRVYSLNVIKVQKHAQI